jgi:two-component system sensor histidine kinase/response regulator
MKILIIEDDPGLRENLRDLLEISGHEVLAAEDGVQGVALAAQGPEFIFCDVNMPNLDGHGALAAIKKMPGVCDVPFVFTTARDERHELRAGMALGADDYITKPYTSADILGAITARTNRQSGLRERIQALSERQQREIHAQWSHELLTPLNAVLGSLDLIEMEADTINRTELKEMLGLIREGAERQERLSRKLINYFSLEQLVHAPNPAPTGRCAADVAIASGAGRGARLKKREADLAISAEPAEVALHEQWLALTMGELVENAATFSTAGTTIMVKGTKAGRNYRITVSDQGSGLSAEQRAGVGAFTQFDRKSREQQGLGLGLTIARLTAQLAGGELRLDAGAGGKGLQVEFLLPLA